MRDYLNECQKIEQVMGEVYRKLAAVRSYSEELRSIFERMAQDEEDHARQLEMAKGVPRQAVFEGVSIGPEKLASILRRAKQLLQMTENPLQSESLMLETAKDMEMQTMKAHLEYAVRFRDARMAQTFRNMARADEQHFETLDAYCGHK